MARQSVERTIVTLGDAHVCVIDNAHQHVRAGPGLVVSTPHCRGHALQLSIRRIEPEPSRFIFIDAFPSNYFCTDRGGSHQGSRHNSIVEFSPSGDASIGFVEEHEVYLVIGEEGFARLVGAFYRQIPNDDILGPIYPPQDLEGAEERLRDFLIYRFGGPQRYIENRGHPRLRMRHAPFPVNVEARDRWLKLMDVALSETGFPPEVQRICRSYFESTATAMMNR